MDIVALVDSLKPAFDWIAANWQILALAFILYAVFLWSRGFWKRLFEVVEKLAFSNWQLALLGATGLILSLASGWTTWDGMRNFTNEPLLSLMITFGIQGVMLIVAWLIGESFASGMNVNRSVRSERAGFAGHGFEWVAGAMLGIVIVGGTIVLIVRAQEAATPLLTNDQLLFGAVALASLALVAILQGDLLSPYVQSSKIILRNAVLWVMFLACMATSVFFSFDSLFSTIFPQSERIRAAELRAQNQVAGIVSDIGQTIATRRLQEAEALFSSPGWLAYERQLDKLAGKAQGAQAAIEDHFNQQIEQRNTQRSAHQERLASAESQQSGLKIKSIQLNEEISRLQAERPEAAAAVDRQRQVVLEIQRRLDEQRAKVLAEEKGVEGTGKVGRGQQWRTEKAAEERMRAEMQVANERLGAPQKRMNSIDERVATIKAELAQIEGQLAQLQGEAQTAEQRISNLEASTGTAQDSLKVDPSRVLPSFERAKVAFRQDPTAVGLTDLQLQCTNLLGAMAATQSTKESVREIDCDPKSASEAASVVFALNNGTSVFNANCAGGERLEQLGSTDALFGFARKCLSDSGLPSKDTDALRTKINFAELNRDDKAHRFVVTWNAFGDGNRLAYLALAIAIAIDALVFMSGLFGANAVRSPLQDVPRRQARSAQQLEAVIENALQPHPYENARAAIAAMRPIESRNGFTQRVTLSDPSIPDYDAVLNVLNAACSIGAATEDQERPDSYLVRPELFEFLSILSHRHYKANDEHRRLAELNRLITVALQPHVGDHAAVVLHNMHPINEHNEFTSEVLFKEIEDAEKPIVKRALNAASVLSFVKRDTRPGEADRFYVHRDLYKTLMNIAAANQPTGMWREQRPMLTGAAPGARDGGRLSAQPRQVAAAPAQQPALSDHSMKPAAGHVADQDIDEDTAVLYAERMLAPIGLDYTDVRGLLTYREMQRALGGVRKALEEQSLDNAHLKSMLREFEDGARNGIAKAYSQLRGNLNGDKEKNAVAAMVEEKLMQLCSLIILLPKLDIFQQLIEAMDRKAIDQDDHAPEDLTVLQQLVAAREILLAGDVDAPETWQSAAQALRESGNSGEDADVLPFRNSRGTSTGSA
ncbi:MAG: hypothetical protein KJ587_10435 [Alphaproteobacteria bacterium]|nr:hypothetical protein [Alphaproteobacteria bacterium]